MKTRVIDLNDQVYIIEGLPYGAKDKEECWQATTSASMSFRGIHNRKKERETGYNPFYIKYRVRRYGRIEKL